MQILNPLKLSQQQDGITIVFQLLNNSLLLLHQTNLSIFTLGRGWVICQTLWLLILWWRSKQMFSLPLTCLTSVKVLLFLFTVLDQLMMRPTSLSNTVEQLDLDTSSLVSNWLLVFLQLHNTSTQTKMILLQSKTHPCLPTCNSCF